MLRNELKFVWMKYFSDNQNSSVDHTVCNLWIIKSIFHLVSCEIERSVTIFSNSSKIQLTEILQEIKTDKNEAMSSLKLQNDLPK